MKGGSCHCGGDRDTCADLDEHTGPHREQATRDDARRSSEVAGFWDVGRCSACRLTTTIVRALGVCDACARAERRRYFSSERPAL